MTKISKDLLSDDERIRAYTILSRFPNIRRDLVRYGYYEKGAHVTASPEAAFSRENTETDLQELSWLVSKLREIHYNQIFNLDRSSFRIYSRKERKTMFILSSFKIQESCSMDARSKSIKDDNNSNLFQASLIPISNLSSGTFSIVINPFGEAYPELGSAEGVGLKTIFSIYTRWRDLC